MGDSTYAEITVARTDLDKVKQIFLGKFSPVRTTFDYFEEHADGSVTIGEDSLNWGGEREIDELVKAGVPFTLQHSPGGSYGAGAAAYDGEKLARVNMLEGELVIRFDEKSGVPEPGDVKDAIEYIRRRDGALAAIARRASNLGLSPPAQEPGKER